MMKENFIQVIISLVSGLIGVLIGSLIQIIYNNKNEKRKIRQDYIKLCILEWIKLKDEVSALIANPSTINNTLFRQNLLMKIDLLSYIGNTNNTNKKISTLKEQLTKEDERISLDGKAEECLNIGKDKTNKTVLIRDIHHLTDIVLKELKDL